MKNTFFLTMTSQKNVFTSVFTDSPHEMNVRYHTSKLLGPTPSPHPMIRERKKETSDFCKNEFLRSKKIARQQK